MKITDFLKRRGATIGLIIAAVLALVGVLLAATAMRGVQVRLPPGRMIEWNLLRTSQEIGADGKPKPGAPIREEKRRLELIAIGPDGEAVVRQSLPDGSMSSLERIMIGRDGQIVRHDGVWRDQGVAVEEFDLGYLLLPQRFATEIEAPVRPACLPPDVDPVKGKIYRRKNDWRPEFKLSLPTMTWAVHDATGARRYRQLSKVSCVYRFHPNRGVVDQAVFSAVQEEETAEDTRRFQLTIRCDVTQAKDLPNPAAITSLARTILDVQGRLGSSSPSENWRDDLDRALADANADNPLTQVGRDLIASASQRRTDPSGRAVLLVCQRDQNGRGAIEIARTRLVAAGLPALIHENGNQIALLVGPFEGPRSLPYHEAHRLLPGELPRWIKRQ
jgi:hypothetical protein